MKGLFRFALFLTFAPLLCGAGFVVGYVLIVGLTIPQLPEWAQEGVTEWMLDIPQDTERSDNGSNQQGSSGSSSSYASQGSVEWHGYIGMESGFYNLPFVGPVRHWGTWTDKPLLGCVFHDPLYTSHTGADFPVNEGTSVLTPMSGEVVWAGPNGPWGNLVVIENNGYQVYLAHLSSVIVSQGDILVHGEVVGMSGNTGNSTGPHLHLGIKKKTGEGTYVWLDPLQFFNPDDYIYIGCSD